MLPILFKLPFGAGFPIYSYGVMLGLSFVVGWYLTLGLAKRDGLPIEPLKNCYVITAISAVAGSRLLYVATNWDAFDGLMSVVELRSGGMVAYGGFLGGFAGSLIYLAYRRFPLMVWADVAVPSLAAGLFVSRVGCYLFGCDFGRPLGEGAPAWLVRAGTFPRWPDDSPAGAGSPAFIHHVETLGLDPTAEHAIPVHPTQLYEAALGLGLLGLLFVVRRRQRFHGQVFFTFTFVYGLARFLLEFLRDDVERGAVPPSLLPHQLYAISFALFAVAFSVGLAQLVKNGALRTALSIAAFVPAIVTWVKLTPEEFATVPKIQLSTSQALGLGSAVAAMVAFGVLLRFARRTPELALVMPDLSHLAEPEEEAEEPSKKSSTKKRAVAEAKPKRRAAKDEPAAEESPTLEGADADDEPAPRESGKDVSSDREDSVTDTEEKPPPKAKPKKRKKGAREPGA